MKKTVWKPTREELEEMGFGECKNNVGDKMPRLTITSSEYEETFIILYKGDFILDLGEDDRFFYPRSKEELQAFISMFEEDE